MKTVYINYTDSITVPSQKKWSKYLKSGNKTEYHGGGNYSNMLLQKLQKHHDGYEFVLLWPKDRPPQTEFEKTLFHGGDYTIQQIKSLSDDIDFIEGSTLFLPVLHNPADYKTVKRIKSANPSLKIVATIHDLRSNFNNYGGVTRYYFTGIKYHLFFLQKPMFWFLNKFYFNRLIKKGMSALDRIFTDSNYSLQQIIKYPIKGSITTHFLSLPPGNTKICPAPSHDPADNFFLFVSGGRPVKNFLRTLEAFCIFKEIDENNYFLYVTGVDGKMLDNMMRYKGIKKKTVSDYVRPMGYVDEAALDSLYGSCNMLLYTSLYEGFGLPLLEAARRGRPAISSYASSIPEVLGSCTYYTDPYNVKSIAEAMAYMAQEDVLKQYEDRVSRCFPVLEQRGQDETETVIEYILEKEWI